MPELHLQCFGPLRVTFGGRPVTSLTSPKQQSLLAWLLLAPGHPQSRRQMAFSLWPDSGEAQALTNLRRELHHLKHSFPDVDRYLEVTAQTLRWRQDALYHLDVAEFLSVADTAPTAQSADLERAAALYTADLLGPLADAWLEPVRASLHHKAVDLLDRLLERYEQGGDGAGGLHYAEQLLALDPLREPSYARLMRLHLKAGDHAAAAQVYQRCVAVFKSELGLRPGAVVQVAYQDIQAARIGAPPVSPGALPLIGRQPEWSLLVAAWRSASAGRSQALIITGEAGIGKTRLAEALLELLAGEHARTARTRSYAAEGRLAYAPITEWLRQPALQAALPDLEPPWRTELARLLPELAPPHVTGAGPLTESWQRQRLFEALARAFLSGPGPLLLLLDDVQWCDQDTLEWLHYLLRFGSQAPLLLLCTLRSDEQDATPALRDFLQNLDQRGLLSRISLGPLSLEETGALAASMLPQQLPPQAQAELFLATEGQPLYIVEAVRAGLTSSDTAQGVNVMSSRVRAVITARLDQLSPAARSLTQLAATIGRAFEVEVLRQASDLEEEALVTALDELWQRTIIRRQPASGGGYDVVYDFTHDRLREGAYEAISPARRRLLHRRVAQALEVQHATDLDEVAAPLAVHHEQAGQLEQAVRFYLRAAGRASSVAASQQAVVQARQALRLTSQLPAGLSRDHHELNAHTSLAAAFNALRGFASPELETHLNRALRIAEHLGDERAIIASLWGLYALQIVRGNVRLSRHLAERALSLAGDDGGLLTDCHQALGGADLVEGRLASAAEHFAVANRLYHQHGRRQVLFGADVGAFSLSWGAHGLWLQGRIEEAREQVARAAAIATELDHPFTQMQTAAYRAVSHQLERQVETAWDSAEKAVSGCQKYQIAYYHEWGVIVGGWAQAMRGEKAAGLERIELGLAALRQQNAALRLPYYLALKAEIQLLLGQPQAARAALDSAQATASQNGDVWYLPELHRLRGLSRPATDHPAQAEACFRRALKLAGEQGSLSLALRAATSLAQHLHAVGRTQGALSVLEPAEAAFPAPLLTPDLHAARTLLQTLS